MLSTRREPLVGPPHALFHTGVFSKHTFGLLREAHNLGILLSILGVDVDPASGPVLNFSPPLSAQGPILT